MGQIGMGYHEPKFPFVRQATPLAIEEYMQKAELVISHGGTGMLSTLYKLRKPCIVVPKQVRYGEANDSQVELAEKWAELGMAVLCMDVSNLEAAIGKCRNMTFKFPTFPSLGEHLSDALRLSLRLPVAGSLAR